MKKKSSLPKSAKTPNLQQILGGNDRSGERGGNQTGGSTPPPVP